MIIRLHITVLENIIKKFNDENGYFVWNEVPGWLRAHGYNLTMKQDDVNFYAKFDTAQEATKFLLEWA